MAWQPHRTLELLTWLKFAVRSTLVLSGFILGLVLLWFTARFSFRFVEWLENTLFSTPW